MIYSRAEAIAYAGLMTGRDRIDKRDLVVFIADLASSSLISGRKADRMIDELSDKFSDGESVLKEVFELLEEKQERPVTTKYASVSWTPGDVQTLRPQMSLQEAEEWLLQNQKYMADRLVELGWEVMEILLSTSGK